MRVQDWPQRLDRIIREASDKPYELGVHDCFTLATRWLHESTGADKRGLFQYHTQDEAMELIRQHGGFEAAFSWFFDGPMIEVRRASRGDICGYSDRMKHLGICIGAKVAVLGESGLDFVGLSRCFGAWRI